MIVKSVYHYFQIVIFTSFFFLWGINLEDHSYFSFLKDKVISDYRLSFIIVILLFPIFYKNIKIKSFSVYSLFSNQKKIILFVLFIILHFFLVKLFSNETIDPTEIFNIIYLILLALIYCNYRHFLSDNFEKILFFYLLIFIFFSIYNQNYKFNTGQCHVDFFLIDFLKNNFNFYFTNSFYLENSHLAMMNIAVFFSSMLVIVNSRKINKLFLILLLLSILISLNNLSTTFFVGYFLSQIFLIFMFIKKINFKFWIFSIMFLFLNFYLFFSDKNCTKKITEFSNKDIAEINFEKKKNITTQVYERSIMVALKTLKNKPFGWGIDGIDNATINFFKDPILQEEIRISVSKKDKKMEEQLKHTKSVWYGIQFLNLKDGLSNFLKMLIEFGILTFIIIFLFLKYVINLKKLHSYNIFIIVLFITLSIRSVGYFSGGFIFCIFEILYVNKVNQYLK